MSQRKSWKPQEDQILRLLYNQRGMNKWNQIAIAMKQQFGIFGRNGKQCRQRYHNHLDTQISKGQWSLQQEKQLICLHNQMGNRWAQLAKKLPGRTDNCVKNRFYTKLRKGIKILNQHISQYFKRKFKLLKPEIIYKILQINEEKYKNIHLHSKEAIQTAFNIKNQILAFSQMQLTKNQKEVQEVRQFISQINSFNKKNKRKSQKKASLMHSQSQQQQQASFEEQENQIQVKEDANQNQLPTINTFKRITRLNSASRHTNPKSPSIKEILSSQNKKQQKEVQQHPQYLNRNKDTNMISLMNTQKIQKKRENMETILTKSSLDIEIDFLKDMNDELDCLNGFISKDIFGYEQI